MYQALFRVQGKSFRMHKLSQYALVISIGPYHVRIACISEPEKRCLALEVYQLTAPALPADQLAAMQKIFQHHAFLATPGWKQAVAYIENQEYTLVPTALFQETAKFNYLQTAIGMVSGKVRHCTHTDLGLTVIFTVPTQLIDGLAGIGHYQLVHQANGMIATCLAYAKERKKKTKEKPVVFAYIQPGHVHITAIKQERLVYYNRFAYTTPAMLLQYILMVMSALSLNPAIDEVIFMGTIGQDSPTYKMIQQYIRFISIIVLPIEGLQYSWRFKKDFIRQHLDLLNFYPATNYLAILK
jgi:hypothetical protein